MRASIIRKKFTCNRLSSYWVSFSSAYHPKQFYIPILILTTLSRRRKAHRDASARKALNSLTSSPSPQSSFGELYIKAAVTQQ